MSLFKTEIKPDKATGKVAETYEFLKERFGKVPNVMQLHTVNPFIFGNLMEFLGYYSNKSNLDIEMLAYIRTLVSKKGNCTYCVKLNSAILLHLGKKQEEINQAMNDWQNLIMDEKRKELVLFALKVAYNEKEVSQDAMKKLIALGWTEKDIYDASMAATKQYGMIQMIKAFQVEIDL